MKRTLLRLAVCVWLYLFSAPGLAEAPADIKWLVLNAAVSDPFSNAEQTGFIERLVATALERLDYRLEVVRIPAERALIVANEGINDGELLRIAGLQKNYPNLIQVPEKLIDLEFVAFTRDKSIKIAGWQDLATHSVAIITGWKIFEQHIPATTELVSVKNADQLFTLLLKDRTDVILYSRWSGLAYIQNHQLQDVSVVEPPLALQGMYVYLHKRHRDLVPLLSKELHVLKTEGEYQRLFREILAPYAGD